MKTSLSIARTTLIYGALLLVLMSAVSCSSDSGGSSDAGAAPGPGPASSNITVAANPTSLTANGTSTITATVKDSNGNLVADGTSVTFSLSSVAYGSLSNTTVTTAAGVATTTFTAGTVSGSVTITATSGGNSNFADLTVGSVSAGSIQFVSASPKILGIKGTGQSETSTIQFLVNDVNGNPVNGAVVNFVMTGPNGGEFIGDIDSTPTTASAATVNGIASVLLHSGTIAGPVTITATTTIANGPISSSATPISIGGGVPSATHFSLGTTILNLEGFNIINLQSIINAFMADRFGNYNVLKGTSVSFYTEAGAIDRQGITGEDINDACHGPGPDPACNAGAAGALLRTQDPMPQDVSPALAVDALSIYFGGNEPFRVDGAGITHNPRDGWVTIVAATKGEETFLDENLDGLFTRSYKNDKCPYSDGVICECDGGVVGGYAGFVLQGEKCSDLGKPGGLRSEGFIDLPEDPFIDVNDDGLRDDGQTLGHPYEQFIDADGNGIFDSTNGKWDGPDCQTVGCNESKTIWTGTKVVFSGGPRFYPNPDGNNCFNTILQNPACNATFALGSFATSTVVSTTTGTTTVVNGSFTVIVGDSNLNTLQGGTTITVTATIGPAGTVPSVFTVTDQFSFGPTFYNFSVTNIIPPGTVTVVVTTPNGNSATATITVPLI
jgi:hypothetical protein